MRARSNTIRRRARNMKYYYYLIIQYNIYNTYIYLVYVLYKYLIYTCSCSLRVPVRQNNDRTDLGEGANSYKTSHLYYDVSTTRRLSNLCPWSWPVQQHSLSTRNWSDCSWMKIGQCYTRSDHSVKLLNNIHLNININYNCTCVCK